MNKQSLQPVEQKDVLFYEDEIVAVKLADSSIYVPVKPICDLLGVDWAGQYRRIQRDPVLSTESQRIDVTSTRRGTQPMICLPLDYLSGFLFGLNANRVKEELREKVILYQRECYRVLAEAFQEGRLTADPTFDELLKTDSEAVEAYKMLQAMIKIARQQILIEARLDTHDTRFIGVETRLETLEAQFGDETRTISEDQASQISQAVKSIAMVLSKRSGTNQYGSVYGELYRKFGITSYKLLPSNRFAEAMKFLTDWHQDLVGDAPF